MTDRLKSLIWEYDFGRIDPVRELELVIKRILSHGSVEDLRWLRKTLGDEEVEAFLLRSKGRGIDRRRLRFYQVIFHLPSREVDLWLKDPARKIWDDRCGKGIGIPRF